MVATDRKRTTKRRPRTVSRAAREKRQLRNEQLFRRIFILVVIAVIGAVLAGLGPVWLSAEATRAAQHSEQLKKQIADTLSESETLELRRSALLTSTRLAQVATRDLGMVPENPKRMYIELGTPDLLYATSSTDQQAVALSIAEIASTTDGNAGNTGDAGGNNAFAKDRIGINMLASLVSGSLNTLARLTAGEASTLLVGDVGLAGLR